MVGFGRSTYYGTWPLYDTLLGNSVQGFVFPLPMHVVELTRHDLIRTDLRSHMTITVHEPNKTRAVLCEDVGRGVDEFST